MNENKFITKEKFLSNCCMTEEEYKEFLDEFCEIEGKYEYIFIESTLEKSGITIIKADNDCKHEESYILITNKENGKKDLEDKFDIDMISYSIKNKASSITCSLNFWYWYGYSLCQGEKVFRMDANIDINNLKFKYEIYMSILDAIEWANDVICLPDELYVIDTSMLVSKESVVNKNNIKSFKATGVFPYEQYKFNRIVEEKVLEKMHDRLIGDNWNGFTSAEFVEQKRCYYSMKRYDSYDERDDEIIYVADIKKDAEDNIDVQIKMNEYTCYSRSDEEEDVMCYIKINWDEIKQKYFLQMKIDFVEMLLLISLEETKEDELITIAENCLSNLIKGKYEDIQDVISSVYSNIQVEGC